MNIKGIFYVVTKNYMNTAFGEERWKAFMTQLAQKDNYFANKTLMAVTPIPADKLIVIFDEMCREFFNNDKTQYAMFGKSGAKFVLSPTGPYKSYMLAKDARQFVELNMPKIWSTYFDGVTFTSNFDNNTTHITITEIQMKNYYFEGLVMGFNQQAFKIFGEKTTAFKVSSIAAGDDDFRFQLKLKDS